MARAKKRLDVVVRINGEGYTEPTHIGKHRWLTIFCGDRVQALTTCFTDCISCRLIVDDDGNDALAEFARNVYYTHDGRFWTIKTFENPMREGNYGEMIPMDGEIWTEFPKYRAKWGIADARITCKMGIPVSITMDGETFEVNQASWPVIESFLRLDKLPRRSPRKKVA